MSEIHSSNPKLFTVHDFKSWNPPPIHHIIWDGLLDVGSKLEIFGGEGSWKSGLALNLAYSVSTGRKWMGFRTSPANVLYIVGERGKLAVKGRVEKYCAGTESIYRARPGDVPNEEDRIKSICYPSNVVVRYIDDIIHLDTHAGDAALRNLIDQMIMAYSALPILVIVDPLYKVFGHDLTSQTDFNQFATHIDLILNDYNQPDKNGYQRQMGLVVIHHARKESVDKDGNLVRHGANESFGPRQIQWWFDSMLSCNLVENDNTKTQVKIVFEKYGNAERQLPDFLRVRWDRDTLHPIILERHMPSLPEDEIELRGEQLYGKLEL